MATFPVTVTVLVVDDQDDIRLLVRTLIAAENAGLEVEDELASGEAAISYFAHGDASVVVLDQMMPGMTGIETAREILARRPQQRIVLFSAYLDDDLVEEATAIGIKACVDKRDFREVVATVRSVAAA